MKLTSSLLLATLWSATLHCPPCHCAKKQSDEFRSLLRHVLKSLGGDGGDAGDVTLVGDGDGLGLLEKDVLMASQPVIQFQTKVSPSLVVSRIFRSHRTVIFLFLNWKGRTEEDGFSVLELVDLHFNIDHSYLFIFPRPELELASTLGSSTKLRSIRRLAFIWPTKPGGGNFQLLWPEPPLRRENYPNPKSMTIWSPVDFTKRSTSSIFPPLQTDLKGRKIRVTTFKFPPIVDEKVLADGNKALIGFEASILNTMSLALNFVPHYQPPSDNKFFGFFIEKNNTFVGMLGDLQHGRTDIGMANLWIRTDTYAYLDFSVPYNYDGLCFLIPTSKASTDFLALLRPMSLGTWLWLLGSTLLVAILLVLCHGLFGLWIRTSASQGVLFVIASILREPYPYYPKVPSIRIMLGTFILSSSVIILGYSGTLTSFLTIRLPPKHLERVSDLVTFDAPPPAMLANSINMTKQFLRDPNPAYHPLAKTFLFFPSLPEGLDLIKEGKIVMVGSRFRLEYYDREFLMRDNGEPGSYIMKECWQSLYSAGWGLQKNSPLKELLVEKVGIFTDNGLVQKWLEDSLNSYGRHDSRIEKSVVSEKLTITDMSVAFLTLPLCTLPCLLALASEIALRKANKNDIDIK